VFGEDRNHVAPEGEQRVGQGHGGVEAGGARSGRKTRRSTAGWGANRLRTIPGCTAALGWWYRPGGSGTQGAAPRSWPVRREATWSRFRVPRQVFR